MFDNAYTNANKTAVSIQLITQIIRLFLQSIVIHFDLHPENALVILNTLQVVIIDFGTASDISNGSDDGLIDQANKTEYFIKVNEFKTIISGPTPTYSNKIGTIREIIEYIIEIEQTCFYNMQRLFNTVLLLDNVNADKALASIYDLVKQRIEPREQRPNLTVAGLLFSNNAGEINTIGNAGVQLDTVCSLQQNDSVVSRSFETTTIAQRVAKKNRQQEEAKNRKKSLRTMEPCLLCDKPHGGKRAKSKKTQKKRKMCKRSKRSKTCKRSKRSKRKQKNRD
jgi:hypothetical protein